MDKKLHHYTLDRPKVTVPQFILFVLKLPISIVSWLVSFLIARNITHLALNPSYVKKQRQLHLVALSEDAEDLTAIINLIPHHPMKVVFDFFVKLSSFVPLPFISSAKKPKLSYDNPEDIAYIDGLIDKIAKLVDGTSTEEKCEGKRIKLEDIHLKGVEYLDNKLHAYLNDSLAKRFGEIASKPGLHFYSLETSDGSILDSVEVYAKDEDKKPMSERKFVIACMARDQNYINWLKDFNQSANRIGCTVIGFNYRGVCHSKGIVWTQDNMMNDVLSQVERLIEEGAKPENIGLEGMCLGGAVATLSAAKLHEQGKKVKLYNERSFISLGLFIIGFILPSPNLSWLNPMKVLRYAAAGIVYVLVTPVLWIVGWPMDAATAWDKIPAEYKNYSLVRDYDNPNEVLREDGVVQDTVASLGSYIESQYATVLAKQQRGEALSSDEEKILQDEPKTHFFKVDTEKEPSGKTPHFVPRRFLKASEGKDGKSNHEHMIASFKYQFYSRSQYTNTNEPMTNSTYNRKPLFIANSGGAGHITAMLGIINDMKNIEVTQHQAQLYRDRESSFTSFLTRSTIYLMSVPYIGSLIVKIVSFFHYPQLPNHADFWHEMEKLERSELDSNQVQMPKGRKRKYVDMLLDVSPVGYEAVAIMNTLHRQDKIDDIKMLVQHKESSEKIHYHIVYDRFYGMLKAAAENGTPYTEIISTQPLSLGALCDAVRHYNEEYLVQKNRRMKEPLPSISVHQYMTDLPSMGCDHFLGTLADLTKQQRQQMHLHFVNVNPEVVKSYLAGGKDFKSIDAISPQENPMVRPGFKDPALSQYLDSTKAFKFGIKAYERKGPDNWSLKQTPIEYEDIPANSKVASIMLGSQASDATVDYVKELLKKNFDKIFVFGGLNERIYQPIEDIINNYPNTMREHIRSRIVRLGNQDDLQMAPIMTRANCTVIRGGGLSAMEQLAMPVAADKVFLVHHNENHQEELTSGLSWEDGNVDCLVEHFAKKNIFIKKTSPERVAAHLEEAFPNASSQSSQRKRPCPQDTLHPPKAKRDVQTPGTSPLIDLSVFSSSDDECDSASASITLQA